MKTVKVGQLPGLVSEYAVEVGTSIASLLQIAGLNTDGYDVKVDSITVSDPESAFVTETTNIVILSRQVKGN